MQNQTSASNKKIAVIGQGYVGLPLAIELAHYFPVVGFDINEERVRELTNGIDRTQEADIEKLKAVLIGSTMLETSTLDGVSVHQFSDSQCDETQFNNPRESAVLSFSSDIADIQDAQIFIVTVPTPIDQLNTPDLRPLRKASEMLGRVIKRGDIVIYESTVYPGCTEEECVPVLEKTSGLAFNRDFFVGYSPERINPGDKINTLTTITKVTSGSTPEIAEEVDRLYKTIIAAGTYKAPSIKVAEASKAIENAQRDVNISFVNELALIFDRMGIDTNDVLEAAGTKFNFLTYKPGLVGGHCISVDPYYLTHKAKQLGYYPDVILSGRRVNNSIPAFIASKVVKLMVAKDISIRGAKALILGITFKENCPDIRNTKVVEIYRELKEYGVEVEIYDPWADAEEVYHEYGIPLKAEGVSDDSEIPIAKYEAIILATAHQAFLTININQLKKEKSVVFDAKSMLPRAWVDARL
ncbi:nucleotide sugar dehydrogenase [Sphingobacterium corticibacterium]|uniref:Nucleotide sugar dehydrogenase n=1 Tax=Sphingobacterium corticibacterium TaxID=2484746 RepID=A0A4V2DBR4_9SPHI|nr:nucleotide sugar dehydrogenase [Sphingobacterium corticibacterium]RZF58898.1 nucleotide sugar dehydrogenase [Sphingobacterium corticibacterium]